PPDHASWNTAHDAERLHVPGHDSAGRQDGAGAYGHTWKDSHASADPAGRSHVNILGYRHLLPLGPDQSREVKLNVGEIRLVIVRQDSEVRADGAAWANHGPAQPHDRRSAIDASVVADDGAGLDVRADVYPRAGLELYPARTQAGGPQRGELVLEPQTDASSNPGHAHRRETYKTVFGGSR